MQPEIVTRRYFLCPTCGGESEYDHLVGDKPRTFGPWYCQGSGNYCRGKVSGTVNPDGTLDVQWTETEDVPGLSLLYFRGLYCIYEKSTHNPRSDDFFFHSHQCPTNLMKHIAEVFDPEHGSDPHGVFRHVASIPDTLETRQLLGMADTERDSGGSHRLSPSLASVFAVFRTDGQPSDSEWPEKDAGVVPDLAEVRRKIRADRSAKA